MMSMTLNIKHKGYVMTRLATQFGQAGELAGMCIERNARIIEVIDEINQRGLWFFFNRLRYRGLVDIVENSSGRVVYQQVGISKEAYAQVASILRSRGREDLVRENPNFHPEFEDDVA